MITRKILVNATPKGTDYVICDGRGLYLKVCKSGRRTWYYRYYRHGRDRKIKIGTHPQISLSLARLKCDQIRDEVSKGLSPQSTGATFAVVAADWHNTRIDSGRFSARHLATVAQRVKTHLLPFLAPQAIKTIKRKQLVDILMSLSDRGLIVTAHRIAGIISQIYTFAEDRGWIELGDAAVTRDLARVLPPQKSNHFATTTDPQMIGAIMRSVAKYTGSETIKLALRFVAYTMTRSGEVRRARWSEIDVAAATWTIPPEHMKRRITHKVPLPRQAMEILKQVRPLTYNGPDSLIFRRDNSQSRGRANTHGGELSDAALLRPLHLAHLQSGGQIPQITVHGFRTMASTTLHEHKWPRELIEMQLSHKKETNIEDIYNQAERLEERREMLQFWADWLDKQRDNIE